MKRVAFLLLLAVSARADDVAQGLQNLTNIYTIAQTLELRLATGATPDLPALRDPWGTEYRVDIDAYRIVSAGSDRTFDEASWQTVEQFAGTAGDVVFAKGAWLRTNHNWLCRQATPAASAELAAMRNAEFVFMSVRTEPFRTMAGPRLTALAIEMVAAMVEAYRTEHGSLEGLTLGKIVARSPQPIDRDVWGTRLRLEVEGEKYRIVSAGADRTFDPMSWSRPPLLDPAEDIVFENGRFKRQFDETAYMERSAAPAGEPVKQPPDARLPGKSLTALREDEKVEAPVVVERVEPEYPEMYRMLRISGISIVEASITDTGAVEDVVVLKSIGPAIDMAAVDAVRKWKFKPARRENGEPVPVLFNLTINFKLN